jgi:hypothetical protein
MWEDEPLPDGGPSLSGVRLKLGRAVEHLDRLEAETGAYSQRQPYDVGGPAPSHQSARNKHVEVLAHCS